MAKTEIRGGQILDTSVSLTADVTGTLPVANGGSGTTTLTGLVKGNGTSAFTAVTAPSGTVVGTTDTQTLTNKTISQSQITDLTTDLGVLQTLSAVQAAQIAARQRANTGYWVDSGLDLGVSGTAGKLSLAAGVAVIASANLTVAVSSAITGTNTSFDDITEMAHATLPKWVVVEMTTSGTITYTGGTAAAAPVIPAFSASTVPLGLLYIPGGASNSTTIDTDLTNPNGNVKLVDMRERFGVRAGNWTSEIHRTSNFTTTNLTAPGDDTGLTATMDASARYEFEALLQIASTATGGLKLCIDTTATSSPTINAVFVGNSTSTAIQQEAVNAYTTNTANAYATTNNVSLTCMIKGFVGWSGSGGTFTIRVTKISGGTAYVNTGSLLKFRKIF